MTPPLTSLMVDIVVLIIQAQEAGAQRQPDTSLRTHSWRAAKPASSPTLSSSVSFTLPGSTPHLRTRTPAPMPLGNELRISGGEDYTQRYSLTASRWFQRATAFGNPCKCTRMSKTLSDPQSLGNAYSQAALFMVLNEGVWVEAREFVFLGGA